MRYRKSKHYIYFGFRKSSLVTVSIILALLVLAAATQGFGGQQKVLSPVGEGISPTATPTKAPKTVKKPFPYTATASWYGTGPHECLGCRKHYDENGLYYLMSNKERLDDERLTVAHKTLPLGTKVKFLRDEGDGQGWIVTATVTDRGPVTKGRDFDFTKAVWNRLGGSKKATMTVRWEVVK